MDSKRIVKWIDGRNIITYRLNHVKHCLDPKLMNVGEINLTIIWSTIGNWCSQNTLDYAIIQDSKEMVLERSEHSQEQVELS